MVWYESARLTHGRVEKLKGASFENIFVHYMPKYVILLRQELKVFACQKGLKDFHSILCFPNGMRGLRYCAFLLLVVLNHLS